MRVTLVGVLRICTYPSFNFFFNAGPDDYQNVVNQYHDIPQVPEFPAAFKAELFSIVILEEVHSFLWHQGEHIANTLMKLMFKLYAANKG